MLVVARRILRQIIRDRRSIAIIVLAPILLMTLIYFLLGKSDYKPTVVLDQAAFPPAIAQMLSESLQRNEKIAFSLLPQGSDAAQYAEDGHADAVITLSEKTVLLIMPEMIAAKMTLVQDVLQKAMPKPASALEIQLELLHGSTDESTFDSLAYFLLCVLAFFLIFIFAGISFVRERTCGTLERLMRTPVRSVSVVLGYTVGFGFFAIIQSVLLIAYAKFGLGTLFVGSWWLALLVMLQIAMVAVLMGVFVSVLSKSEFQVMQFIPMLIIPQIFFSGLMPVDMLPYHLNAVSYCLPLYYGGAALKAVMVYGRGLEQIWPEILALAGFIALLFGGNLLAVRKARRS